MSENVIEFPKTQDPRRLIWACRCGCTTHYHLSSGEVECAACSTIASAVDGEWREHFPEEPQEAEPVESGNFKITDLGSPEIALKRFAKCLDLRSTAAAIAVTEQGALSTWRNGLDPERDAWLRERMNAGVDRILGKGTDQ